MHQVAAAPPGFRHAPPHSRTDPAAIALDRGRGDDVAAERAMTGGEEGLHADAVVVATGLAADDKVDCDQLNAHPHEDRCRHRESVKPICKWGHSHQPEDHAPDRASHDPDRGERDTETDSGEDRNILKRPSPQFASQRQWQAVSESRPHSVAENPPHPPRTAPVITKHHASKIDDRPIAHASPLTAPPPAPPTSPPWASPSPTGVRACRGCHGGWRR